MYLLFMIQAIILRGAEANVSVYFGIYSSATTYMIFPKSMPLIIAMM